MFFLKKINYGWVIFLFFGIKIAAAVPLITIAMSKAIQIPKLEGKLKRTSDGAVFCITE
ncbi:MAG: hypothetical protein ISR78_00805 [Spirochaetia bacterium]|nr:hypothetical protein [Spirochaetia bacterium]